MCLLTYTIPIFLHGMFILFTTGKDESFERFPSIRCGGLALLLVGPWRPDCEVAVPNTDEGGSA